MDISYYCEFVDEQHGDRESSVRQVVFMTNNVILKV